MEVHVGAHVVQQLKVMVMSMLMWMGGVAVGVDVDVGVQWLCVDGATGSSCGHLAPSWPRCHPDSRKIGQRAERCACSIGACFVVRISSPYRMTMRATDFAFQPGMVVDLVNGTGLCYVH